MRALRAALAAWVLIGLAGTSAAQTAADGLVGTWMLVGLERQISSDEPVRLRGAHGLLIVDAVGHVFEFFGSSSPAPADDTRSAAERTLDNFGGFWGRYAVDARSGQIDFEAEDGVSPNLRGLEFTRSFALDGDRLVLSSTDEPQAQGDARWTWQRVPVVEGLGPTYRAAAGFWQHVEERQVNEATGEVLRTNHRGPSVIVYSPGGFVGVHFPPVERDPIPGESATAEAAQAALRGYIGYFGSLDVYPGEVSHNILEGIAPGPGSILRRFADVDGDRLVVRLESFGGTRPRADGSRTVTEVELKRLSGLDDMLPRER